MPSAPKAGRAAKQPARGRRAAKGADRRWRELFEHASDGIFIADLQGRYTDVNAAGCRMLGYARGEIVGKTVADLIPPEDASRLWRSRQDLLKGGVHISEWRLRRKDGGLLPVEVSAKILADGRWLGFVRDITERRRAREELRRQASLRGEGRFKTALDSSTVAMLLADHDGRIVFANVEAERLFGWRPGDLDGQLIEVLVPRKHRDSHPGHRAAFFREDTAKRAMGRGRDLFAARRDGTEFPVEIGLTKLESEEGEFVVASIIDLTERRRLEKALAQKEALAAVGTMAAVVAHEIRNPLGSIVMAARSLARGGLAPEDADTVQSVLQGESRRLNKILEDFMLFARPREPSRTAADLNLTVGQCLSAIRADESLTGRVVFIVDLDPALPPVPHDPDQLRQVLWNVLLNALEAMDGKGKLVVRSRAGGGQASLEVADTGPGIPADQLERVLEPFYTTKKKGSGLGLAIAQRILLAHGGRLAVESLPRKGARVTLFLPLPPGPR